MTIYVALLRGINVGGKNSLPMQKLRDMLAALGCEDIKTYIQSGNAVFRSDDERALLSSKIEVAVDEKFGFAPTVLLLTIDDYHSILAANPFPDAVDDPKSPTENYELAVNAFYLHAPDGIGRSKLAAKVEKYLGVPATGRNWRTTTKLAELAASIIG